MVRPDVGHTAPTETRVADTAMQMAAWRQLWRLLLQPAGDTPEENAAASDQEAASEETHDAAVPSPK